MYRHSFFTCLARDIERLLALFHQPIRPGRPLGGLSRQVRPISRLAAVLLCAALLAACGGDAPQDSGAAPSDSGGRAVRNVQQLSGAWFSPDPLNIAGLEFTTAGKVMITYSASLLELGPTVTLDYQLLDGGRVGLTQGDGETLVFLATLAGNRLTLVPEQDPESALRFVQLKNQTIAEAHRAEVQRLVQRHEELAAAVHALLARPKLVVKSMDPDIRIGRTALVLQGSPGHWEGTAYPAAASPTQHRAQVIVEETMPGLPLRIRVTVGEVIGPPGSERPMQPHTEIFTTEGDPRSLSLMAQGRRTLTADAAIHDQLVADYEKLRAERVAALEAVSLPLGARAVLAGSRAVESDGADLPVTVTLERVGQGHMFNAVIVDRDARTHSAQAGVGFDEDRAVLFVRQGNNELWQLARGEDGSLAGWWRLGAGNTPQQRGRVALAPQRVWTAEQLAARRQAIERYLTGDLREPVTFTGFASGRIGNADGHWPVSLQLKANPDGTAVGQAWLPAQRGGVELTGNLVNGAFNLSSSRVLESDANFRSFAQQRWRIQVDDVEPEPLLLGDLSMPTGGSGSLRLTPLRPEDTARMRGQVIAALNGMQFDMGSSRHTRQREPTFMRLQADADGKITGDLVGHGLDGAYPPGLVEGVLREEHGHLLAELTVTTSPSPTRGGRAGNQTRFFLVPRLDEAEQLSFRGPADQAIFGQFTLTPATGEVQVDEEQRIRLAAQRAGAATELPRDIKPGDQVLMLVQGTTRGHAFYGGGRYRAVNPQVAAVHAGILRDGEMGVVRLTIAPPHDQAYPVHEQNGVRTQPIPMTRSTQQALTYTMERVAVP